VKGLDEQTAGAGFDVDIAECSEGHASTGVERVEHSLSFAVDRKFLLKHPEDVRGDGFQLKARLIRDSAAAFDPVIPFASEAIAHQPSSLGKWMLCRAGDFGEGESLVPPSDDVAGTRDINFRVVRSTLNLSSGKDPEEFGM
jgi:hypothetical protein